MKSEEVNPDASVLSRITSGEAWRHGNGLCARPRRNLLQVRVRDVNEALLTTNPGGNEAELWNNAEAKSMKFILFWFRWTFRLHGYCEISRFSSFFFSSFFSSFFFSRGTVTQQFRRSFVTAGFVTMTVIWLRDGAPRGKTRRCGTIKPRGWKRREARAGRTPRGRHEPASR